MSHLSVVPPAPAIPDEPAARLPARTHETVGELLTDFLHELEAGRDELLAARLRDAAVWLAEVSLPPLPDEESP